MVFSIRRRIKDAKPEEKNVKVIEEKKAEEQKKLTKEDEQARDLFVKYLHQQKSAKKLTVDDFYNVLGTWNSFYLFIILMNSLVWSLGEVHYRMLAMFKMNRDNFRFVDCDGMIYEELKYAILPSEKKDRDNSSGLQDGIVNLVGGMIGFAYVLIAHRASRPKIILVGTLLYSLATVFWYFRFSSFRVANSLMSIGTKISRLGSIMHCMECLPNDMRPIGMMMLHLMDVLFTLFLFMLLRRIEDWEDVIIVFGTFNTIVGVVYYFKVPNGVLTTMLENDTEQLQYILDRWAPIKKGRKLYVFKLIDDTIYQGNVTFSAFETLRNTLRIAPFRKKLLVLLAIIPIGSLMMRSVQNYQIQMNHAAVFESYIYGLAVTAIATCYAAFFIRSYGRRATLVMSGIISMFGQCFILLVEPGEFNSCRNASQPSKSWSYISMLAQSTVIVAARCTEFISRMMLMEHVPTESRAVVLPVVFMVVDLIVFTNMMFSDVFVHAFIPNVSFVFSFFWSVLVFPFAVFTDNTAQLCICSGEIPCYFVNAYQYPKDPPLDDFYRDQKTVSSDTRALNSQTSDGGSVPKNMSNSYSSI